MPTVRFGSLHRWPDREIAELTEEAPYGSIELFIRLAKDIPELIAFGLVGDVILWHRSFRSCLLSTTHNTMGLR